MSKKQDKTVTMMQLRQHIGEVVNDVMYTNAMYVVEKHGKPICSIQPYGLNSQPILEQKKRNTHVRKLFGALKHIQTVPEDWTKEYDDIEKAYDKRMWDTWQGK